MSQHTEPAPLVVGLSGNAIDRSLHGGGLDGIGVYTLALEAALRASGVQVRRIGARSGARMRRPRRADQSLAVPLAPAIAWSAVTGMHMPFTGNVERTIDVYHATDYRVPRLARTPVIATLYDAIPLAHPEWGNPRLRRLKNWLLRTAASNADRVIAISNAAAAEVAAHYGIDRERMRVVYPGVDSAWFAPGGPEDGARLDSLGLERGYLLFVGTLQPRKNVGMLLRAYDALPEHVRASRRLVIVGKYGWAAESLRSELAHRAGDRRVVWLEHVPTDVLQALYRAAHVFVFPSLAEGFGLPVVEALASGLPVVTLDLPVMREVGGAHVVTAARSDAEAVADAIERALAVPRTPEADASRRGWARRFDWQTCARKTIEVYRECAARK